jgi:hypothetical protein
MKKALAAFVACTVGTVATATARQPAPLYQEIRKVDSLEVYP